MDCVISSLGIHFSLSLISFFFFRRLYVHPSTVVAPVYRAMYAQSFKHVNFDAMAEWISIMLHVPLTMIHIARRKDP